MHGLLEFMYAVVRAQSMANILVEYIDFAGGRMGGYSSKPVPIVPSKTRSSTILQGIPACRFG